jgi:hypothetical protein
MKPEVYKIDDVVFEVEGIRPFAVSGFSLVLRENTVPVLHVSVDPVHDPAAGVSTKAERPGFADAARWQKALAAISDNRRKARFSAVVYKTGDKGVFEEYQKLDIKDWFVVAAGIPSFSSHGEFALSISLMHPAVEADYALPRIAGIRRMSERILSSPESWSADNPVQALSKIYKAYSNRSAYGDPDVPAGSVTGDPVKAALMSLVDRLGMAAAAIDRRFEWLPGGGVAGPGSAYGKWPLEFLGGETLNAVKYSFAQEVVFATDTSPVDVLCNRIASLWGLGMIPCYWRDKLAVAPFSPWSAPSARVSSSDLSKIEFPPSDPNRLIGVMMNPDGVYGQGGTTSLATGVGSDIHRSPHAAVFIPPGVLSNPALGTGRIVEMARPDWIERLADAQVRYGTTPLNKGNGSPADYAGKVALTPGELSKKQELVKEATKVAVKYAYYSTYKRLASLSVHGRLHFKSPGSSIDVSDGEGYICPGFVYSIVHEGAPVLRFYADTVVHTVDRASGKASTSISGGYATEDPPASLLTPMFPNPLYSKGP